ncbi:MAG: transketolase family protein, partial [Anaerolineae bacterium]|nr:transketolase family protein [Anaerolineae bacterium]
VYGGLGEACAAVLMQEGISLPFRIVGIPHEHIVNGEQSEVLTHYGISADSLAMAAKRLLGQEART